MTAQSTQTDRSRLHLFAAVAAIAEQLPDKPAVVGYGGKGSRYTYGELRRRVTALAASLRQPPYDSMAEIGLLSENRPEWTICYLAIVAAGKTVVPIDANYRASEVKAVVEHAKLEAVFCSARCDSLLGEIGRSLRVLSLDSPGSRNDAGPHEYADTFESMSADGGSDTFEPGEFNETAVLIYTSGTTGTPKAVMLTHTNLLSNVRQAVDTLGLAESDTFLSVLPLHHTFEATCGFLAPLTIGATIVYARSLKSKEILEDLGANNVSIMCGVPLLYEKMYQSMRRKIASAPLPRRALFHTLYTASSVAWRAGRKAGVGLFASLRTKAGLSTIRLFVSGGAALPPRIAEFFNLIGFTFLQGYGLTECSPVVSVNRPEDIEFGSVGPPLNDVDVRIANPDTAGIGEIIVRGPNTTPGYRDNPEATAELLKDGWLHTGDLGHIDQRGHVWITGRAKNVIVSAAGKNIYPEEIEEKLVLTPSIDEAVVFGRQNEKKHGEEVLAVLVPDFDYFAEVHGMSPEEPDESLIETAISEDVKQVNAGMAEYKRIASFDISLTELEKTSTKKIKRFLYK
ncbi:AMP-binding protein [candidate division GN15 bacterium]|nr:AMP-binding protein [candidate division GN15 bacterium]